MKKISAHMMILGTLLLLGFVSNTWAGVVPSKVILVPTSPTTDLVDGDFVTFDVFIDFSADGGTLGGGFDVVFDPTALAFVDLTSANLGDPDFGRDPDVLPGLLRSWAVGEFNGFIGVQLVGSMKFQVKATMGATTSVEATPTGGIGGPWVSAADNISILNPEYSPVGGVVLSSPPIPTTYEYNGTVTFCQPAVCNNFAALKVGSLVAGTIDIFTSPNTVFNSDDVGAFSYTVTNPDLPITPSEPPPADTVANPLYVFYVDATNFNALDIETAGLTDNNNLFAPGAPGSLIQVLGTALQGYIYQDLSQGGGCFNASNINSCSQEASLVIWEGEYFIEGRPNVMFTDGFESN